MPFPIQDCQCEDFPCCGHADNFPPEGPKECGGVGHSTGFCKWDEEDEELDYDEEEEAS